MSAPTRQRLLDVATNLFAERGYQGTTIREIVARANANQAAVSYHFNGKEGLYMEVLKAGFQALAASIRADPRRFNEGTPSDALRLFLQETVGRALFRSNPQHAILRVLAWESISPSGLAGQIAERTLLPHVTATKALLRRFLGPDADEDRVLITAIWLIGQGLVFAHGMEVISRIGTRTKGDESFQRGLIDDLHGLALGGLQRAAGARAQEPALELISTPGML